MARVAFIQFVLLSVMLIKAHAGQSRPFFFDRHNFGVVLTKKGEIQVATASAKLLFHYELPPKFRPREENINCSMFSARGDSIGCHAMRPLLRAMQNLELQASKHLQNRLEHIYDALFDFADRNTAKRGIFSSILSKITGLAEQDDVDRITDLMTKVERGVQRASEAWQSGTSHITAAFKLEKTRVDNIYALLAMQRKSMFEFQSQFIDIYRQANVRTALTARIADLLGSAIFQLSEVDDLFNAIQILSTNKLPHFFISHATMQRSLNYLRWYLNKTRPDLMIIKQDVRFYFQQGTFNVFRHNRHLLIIINIPLTLPELIHPLDVLDVQKIPLLSPNTVDHYTMLAADLGVIAYHRDVDYYFTASSLSDLPGDIVDIRYANIVLRRRAVQTCALVLIEGDLDDMKKYCGYHIIIGPIPRGIHRLTERTFLFTNITKITLRCKNNDTDQNIVPDHVQTVYEQHCSCQIMADEFLIPQATLHCKQTDNITLDFTPKYLINLPFLSGFVDTDTLKFLRDYTLLNKSIPALLPQLAVASKSYDAKLALEKQSRFDMDTLINTTLQDSTMYKDLGHYLFNNLLLSHSHDESFDIFNVFHWVYLLATICGILGLVLAVLVHCRVRTLFLLLAKSSHANAFRRNDDEPKLPTLIYPKTSATTLATTLDPLRFHKMIQTLLPVDLTLLLCLILFIVVSLGYLLFRYKQSRKARTGLIIEIANAKQHLAWKLQNLRLSPGCYRVIVNQQAVTVKMTQLLLSGVLNWGECIVIQNKALNLPVAIKSHINVYPWRMQQVRNILREDFYLAMYVTDAENDIVDTVVVKTMHAVRNDSSQIPDKRQSLYPALDSYPV